MSQYQIKIKEPCHENWNAMLPKEQGRFCGSCIKEVVDFTTMSDQEVKNYLLNNKGSICGRFKKKQLEKKDTSYFNLPRYTKQFVRAFAMVFIMFTSCNTGPSNAETMGVIEKVSTHSVECTGTVFDENGSGISDAKIKISNNVTISTDKEGRYTVSLERGEYDIEIFKVGYIKLETGVMVSESGTFGDFELQPDVEELMGDISIEMGEATMEETHD